MLTRLRELAAAVGSFDRSALEPGYALRCTAGVAIPLGVAALLGKPALGVAPAIGAFIAGFTSLQGVYRTRLQAIVAAAAGMALTSFIGALAAHSTAGLIAATAVAGYACGTIGQLGPAAATASLNSFVAFVLFSSQPLEPGAALAQSLLVLGGGLLQALLLLAAWPSARLGAERSALADVYARLAGYARSAAQGSPQLPPITPLATARQVLSDPQPFARAAERARLNRLLEDAELIRRRLGGLASTRAIPAIAAEQLEAIAQTLRGRLRPAAVTLPEVTGMPELSGALRDATLAATMLADGRLPQLPLLSKPRPGPYVENRFSWCSREALRFGLVLAVAMLLARHFSAERGYWIPLTAAIVLKPDFQTTFVRGFARIGGTLVGAAIATLLLAALRAHPGMEIAGVLVVTFGAYLCFYPNYALFTVAITSFVVLVLSMRGLPGSTTIGARVLDTIAGGALAMIGYLAMPTWERKRTRALLADLLEAQRDLAAAILAAYAAPSHEARARIERARTLVWQARTVAEASIDRTQQEPHRPHTIGAGRALRLLAATQRFGLASLALETAIDSNLPSACAAAVASFGRALFARMSELASALRESRRPPAGDGLGQALRQVEASLSAEGCAGTSFIAQRLTVYADATERLARLIGRSPGAAEATL